MNPNRPAHHRFHTDGRKAVLPFADAEYENRLADLRDIMEMHGLDAVLLTSMHNVAYYSGFLSCAFGRPSGCVVTHDQCITISAGLDAGQPWRRSFGDSVTYADWARDNFWRAVASVIGTGKVIGCEADHLTMAQSEKLGSHLKPKRGVDISAATLQDRMVKSPAEIALIQHGANVADLGGHAIRAAVRAGATELEVAMVGRDAMEREIARRFPDAEYRDSWVWLQSGLNTDGAQNPLTSRKLKRGDILSMTCFPVISGYSAALGRTLFLAEVDAASLEIWQTNIAAHAFAKSLLRPGAVCSEVTAQINAFLAERDMLQFRSFGYGQSVGILSDFCGREGGLALREESDTVLEPGMVISMEPMVTIPAGRPGAGGYREQDILVITDSGAEGLTQFPCGPGFNVIG